MNDNKPIWKKKALALSLAVSMLGMGTTLAGCRNTEQEDKDAQQNNVTTQSSGTPFMFYSSSNPAITASNSGWHSWTNPAISSSGGYSGVHATSVSA